MAKINLLGQPDPKFAKADTIKRSADQKKHAAAEPKPKEEATQPKKPSVAQKERNESDVALPLGSEAISYYVRIGRVSSERIDGLATIASAPPEALIKAIRKGLPSKIREQLQSRENHASQSDQLHEDGYALRGTVNIPRAVLAEIKREVDPFDLGLSQDFIKTAVLNAFYDGLAQLENRIRQLS